MPDIQKEGEQNLEGNHTISNVYNDKTNKKPENLIIDDNTVYEIDPDCYEKVKRARMNQKKSWDRK